ncbi:hypothetical protein [Brevibacillus agri]|uniref:hypothetical protein n=1 Tax=Brevibacillus agri TaxID=51101 RepID=UPI003D1A0950
MPGPKQLHNESEDKKYRNGGRKANRKKNVQGDGFERFLAWLASTRIGGAALAYV